MLTSTGPTSFGFAKDNSTNLRPSCDKHPKKTHQISICKTSINQNMATHLRSKQYAVDYTGNWSQGCCENWLNYHI
ncbi:unnamed protein product, partial [Allacma fusca]